MDPTPYIILYFECMIVMYSAVFVLILLERLVVGRPA
jgi:hypothetical protein